MSDFPKVQITSPELRRTVDKYNLDVAEPGMGRDDLPRINDVIANLETDIREGRTTPASHDLYSVRAVKELVKGLQEPAPQSVRQSRQSSPPQRRRTSAQEAYFRRKNAEAAGEAAADAFIFGTQILDSMLR